MSAQPARRPNEADRRMGFVLALRQAGTLNARVLAALERLDRARFAPGAFRAIAAHGDVALPLPDCQSMTQPSVVARVLEALSLDPSSRVLEIGTGSGYQTAAIAALAGEVVSMERVGVLASGARAALAEAGVSAQVLHADGSAPPPVSGAFQAIVVNAALTLPPTALLSRLAPGGVLVAPFGHGPSQRLVRVRGAGAGFALEDLGLVRFAALGVGLA